MATAAWLAAVAKQSSQAGQINQFLGSHDSAWTYTGNVLQSSQSTGNSVYTSTTGQYLSQTIATASSQTTIGQVWLQISTVGGSPLTATIAPLTVSLYASLGGQPTGSALISTNLVEQFVYSAPFWLNVPLIITGLTGGTQYQLVVSPAGSGTAYYVWQHSTLAGGANTSPDGVNWTSAPYSLMYQVYDATGATWPPLTMTDDNGARVTQLTYNATGQLTGVTESVVAQGGGSFFSSRTISYNGLFPTGVS